MDIDALAVALRALGYAALLQAAGAVLARATLASPPCPTGEGILRLARRTALVALVALAAGLALEAGRLAGEFRGILDPSLQWQVLASPLGTAFAARAAGMVVILVASGRAALAGVALAVASFTMVGHSLSHAPRWLLAPLLALHVLVAAWWLGSMVPLLLIARREPPAIAQAAFARCSQVLGALVPTMIAAGIVLAWQLLAGQVDLADPFCALLATKATLLVPVLALAALNRWRLGPALASGAARARRQLAASLVLELILLAAIIAVTATLTALYSPAMPAAA